MLSAIGTSQALQPTSGLLLIALLALAERIARIVDSDTAVTASGKKAWLMHSDAPETHGDCPRERDSARREAAPLRRLAASGLELERHGTDRYGRTLAKAGTPAGVHMEHGLLRAGLGVV